ncbi:coiled-coil domain-containing protein 42-like [Amia ocellicauda]|uniref:coiled-coil domain-containing protein 42-like n=1 Tax=Amia ocellicauda TaxID=2972642 RepID=UPI003463A623
MCDNLTEYFKSHYEENLREAETLSSTGDKFLVPATRMLGKREEAAMVQQALKAQREEFKLTLVKLQVRRDKLREKEVQMKESWKKYDQLFKDNEMKRMQALRKATQERELIIHNSAELANLQAATVALGQQREQLEKRNLSKARYLHYLESVVKASEQFQEVRQVMSRYDTLVLTQEDLLRTAQENQERMDRDRAQLARFREHGHDSILQHNNKLAQLQTTLDAARTNTLHWESRWAHIQNTAAKKTLLLGTIKMATLNLYQTVCKRPRDSADGPIALEDTTKQLELIQNFLIDLISVWEEVSKPDSQPGITTHR